MSETTRTVKLGDKEITLARPSSYALRTEVWLLAASNQVRAYAAALGMCWRGKGRPTVSYEACQFSPAVFGARVLDELVERGLSIKEILAAGTIAMELMVGDLVAEADVEEAEGNSEADRDPSIG